MQNNNSIVHDLKRQAIIKLIAVEIDMLHQTNKRHHTKALRYFNSTPTREMFAKLMVHARMTNKPYSVTQISKLLQVSRPSAQTMVDDCASEGWIEWTWGSYNKRMCQGTQFMEDMAFEWVDLVRKVRDKHKLGHIFVALDVSEEILEEKNSEL